MRAEATHLHNLEVEPIDMRSRFKPLKLCTQEEYADLPQVKEEQGFADALLRRLYARLSTISEG